MNAMEDLVRKAYDAQRTFNNKAFQAGCYAPFVSLYFNTFGEVLACCKNETHSLGNIGRERLNDIWNGERNKMLRQALVNYNFTAGCQVCEWQIAGENYHGAIATLFEEFPVQSMEPEWPAMIEFAGSNTCNFECIMCCGELSSLIRTHRDRLPPLPKVYDEQFFHDLRKFLPHLRAAKFLGGEPFLAEECFKIWNMMIEDRLSIPCHVTTNGSQYNARVERVLEALPVSLSISIDGATKQTVEKIRVHSHYETLMNNIQRLHDYARTRGTYIGFTYCLMRQNWQEFGDFLLFAEDLGCEVFVNTVIDPSHCSLYKLPPEELLRIADEMERQGASLQSSLRLNREVWEKSIRKLRSNANEGRADVLKQVLIAYQYGLGEELTGIAMKLIDKGLYAEALEEVLKTPEDHPFYYHALVLCCRIRRLLGDLPAAERDLERALQITRRRSEAFIERARLRLDQNRFDEGLEDVLHARELMKPEDQLEAELCEVLNALNSGQAEDLQDGKRGR
jgi:radical SAM protein with 4Fe4S-binding SPASM domain